MTSDAIQHVKFRTQALMASSSFLLLVAGAMNATAQEAASEPTTLLERISVEGGGETADGPVDGVVAERSATSTKTDRPLLEVPQSVSVVTADQMREQAVQSTSEALRYVPSVSGEIFGADPRADWIRSRGFQVPEYLDGLKLPRGTYAWPRIDPYFVERMEVLKGPSSGLYGQTPPGGLVNMVSKRPTATPLREVQLQVGAPERVQAAFDFGGPIDDAGTWSYRLTGLGRLGETQVDFIDDDRAAIAPALAWTPSDATSLTVLGHYIQDDGSSLQFLPSEGLALPNPNGQIPRDFFSGEPDFDDFSLNQYAIGYLFEHDFNEDLTLRQNLRYGNVDYDLDVVRGFGFIKDPATGLPADYETLSRRAVRILDDTTALTVDTNLTGRFATGAVEHEMLGGIDYLDQVSDYSFAAVPIDGLNVFDPDYGADIPPLSTMTDQENTQRQLGLYLQDELAIEKVRVVLGGRYDWVDTDSFNRLNGTSVGADDSAFTGRAGLLYAFDNGVSPYVSYSTSFEAQTGTNAAGDPFDPTEGGQIEAGIKYQPLGSDSLFTIAAFNIQQDNIVVANQATGIREQVGQVEVRGIELEAKVDLWRNWDVIASYSYQDSEVTKATDGTLGNRVPYVPDHQASAWLNYNFASGALEGLSVGGGVRYHGSAFGDVRNTLETEGYTLVDAALRYDFGALTPKFEGTELAINASNLFDKEYVASCNDLNTCYWGSGRTVRATLTHRW